MMWISPSYHEDDDDADVFGILPELVSRDHFGVVDESNGEDEQAEQLHQHGGLKTHQNTVRLVSATGLTPPCLMRLFVAGFKASSVCLK